ncbi:MAG: phosphoribosylformylglycinamidine synthase, partial [Planctomycetes bacterium]|nr:phosphoribosylformylglycinamidine synthase [Planctomycetota bacterium]
MLWEVEIQPTDNQIDREGARVLAESQALGANSIRSVRSARSFLIEGDLDRSIIEQVAANLLADSVVESVILHDLSEPKTQQNGDDECHLLNVLFKPGVTDNVAGSTKSALLEMGVSVDAVSTCRKYRFNPDATQSDLERVAGKVLANDAIEQIVHGPLQLQSISVGSSYQFELKTVLLREMNDDALKALSNQGQLFLSLVEMQTIQKHFLELERDPTDVELETIAQTWSEHCSHKTLAGRIHYQDDEQDRHFENMLKETIFQATVTIREELKSDDWCVSVFEDNAGIIKFDDKQNVCFKVETHNHPSALEPYGGANTGIGGVIRDPLGTGMGARPICNTDVFCFAPPETSYDDLPPGILHPKVVAKGVVAGVR